MRAWAAVSVGLYLFVAGCASSQLNYNTLDLATSVGNIQTQQVLYNLSLILDDPAAIPTHVSLSDGSASTNNSIQPGINSPLSQTIAQATATAGIANQLENTLSHTGMSASISAQNLYSQNWDYTPVTDGDELRRLRALYKYALGTVTHAPCPIQRELAACERPFGNEDLLLDYPLVTKSVNVSYTNNADTTNSIYCQDIGVRSVTYKTNASNKAVDKNGITLEDWQGRWKPNPNDSNCDKPNNLQCTGTGGKTLSQWDALWRPGILTQYCASVTDTITVPDETYLHRPSCILCLRQKGRTALYTPLPKAYAGSSADRLTVNERLQLLGGAQFPWLYRDSDALPPSAVWLGHFAKHDLYISKSEKWKLSDFTLFVATATAQSAARGGGGSSGESQGRGQAASTTPSSVFVNGQLVPVLGQ
jgi:hypothetical protein